ncbi:MAG: MobV family relaxase [Clostridium chrysemydis]|uniref:MobV family relaxase n=1 Tax=Clostridium chrysemydis TaxID=2665504 RepID=UPI003F330C74
MSYAIFRTDKMKSTVIDMCQRHNQRENYYYSNEDIDINKIHLNYDLHNNENINYRDSINMKIKERYTSNKAIRKDAILNIECLITSDTDFFNKIGEDETKRYFKEAYEFVKKEFGEDNINYATVHLDETTPHMHLGVTPLTKDGKLTAKTWLNGKKKLTELQNKFHKHVVNKGFDLERGISSDKTKAKNKRILELKKDTLRELEQLKKELKATKRELNTMSSVLYQNSLELDMVDFKGISRTDFEKLKTTAINSGKIQNEFNRKIELLEKENKELKTINDTLHKELNSSRKLHSILTKNYNIRFDKIKEDYEINTLRKDLFIKDTNDFLKERRLDISFDNYRSEQLYRRMELAEKSKKIKANQQSITKSYSKSLSNNELEL